MAMRIRLGLVIALVAVVCCSCSHKATRETEAAVQRAVNQFHADLNQGSFEKIYADADTALRRTITQEELTAQLSYAHEQLGHTSPQFSVFVHDSVWRSLRKALQVNRREIFSHGDMPNSNLVIGQERFLWAVENEQAKLVSYDFRTVCRRPCQISFQIR